MGTGILNNLEVGKLPMLESECVLIGFDDKQFTDNTGKVINYTDVTLSNGIQSFIVSASSGHGLGSATLGKKYLCKFYIVKKKIKLIGLYDLK